MTPRLASSSILSGFDRARWCLAADAFAAGVAVFVPWSTTLTEIFVVLWLVAFLPTLFLPVADFGGLRTSCGSGRLLAGCPVRAGGDRHALGVRRIVDGAPRRLRQISPADADCVAARALCAFRTRRVGAVRFSGRDDFAAAGFVSVSGAARLALAWQGIRRSGQRLHPPKHVLYGLRFWAAWRGGRTRARREMVACHRFDRTRGVVSRRHLVRREQPHLAVCRADTAADAGLARVPLERCVGGRGVGGRRQRRGCG